MGGVIQPDETVAVVTRDGTMLATDIYLPPRPGRVPAVMARTPYGKAGNPVWFAAIGRLFAEHGMAFVAQDVRGHHESGGTLAPFMETSDSWDTLEWIVRQPWSDGSTAVFGESYVGFTAVAAAASGHPSIRAAALRNTSTDITGDWLRHQGVVRLEFLLRWAFAAWAGADNHAPDLEFATRPLERIARSAGLRIAPEVVPDVLDVWAAGEGPRIVSPDAPGWPTLIDRLRVPVHLSTGWWDLFVRGAFRDWSRLSARPGVMSRLVVDPTDHAGHDWGDGPTADPLADFDQLAGRMPEILASEVDFLRERLLGGPVVERSATSWTLTHAGVRHSASWPPPGVRSLSLHLVDAGQARRGPEGGGLSVRPDRVPMVAKWQHDPADLVPALEGESIDGWFRRPDERSTQVRGDVLTFTSQPLREHLDIVGPVSALLVVRPPGAGGHVMAKLCDVYPAGEARRIADGACLLAPAAEPIPVEVGLGHTAYRIRPGHRLRLEISSSAYPRYIPHPGTTDDPWTAAVARPAELGLHAGPDGSRLQLSVLGAGGEDH